MSRKFHNEDSQTVAAVMQSSVARATCSRNLCNSALCQGCLCLYVMLRLLMYTHFALGAITYIRLYMPQCIY
jgi:hypothetical protein